MPERDRWAAMPKLNEGANELKYNAKKGIRKGFLTLWCQGCQSQRISFSKDLRMLFSRAFVDRQTLVSGCGCCDSLLLDRAARSKYRRRKPCQML